MIHVIVITGKRLQNLDKLYNLNGGMSMMQRKKMKKFLGLTVALTVMSSVLTGCGSSTGQEEPATPAQDADDTAGSENNGNDAAATADGDRKSVV